MVKLHYATTSDENLLYLLRHQITDPFYYLATDTKEFVFLNELEIGAFADTNHQSIEAVPLQTVQGNTLLETAQSILEKFANGAAEIVVPTNFPLDLADGLRAQQIKLAVELDWCSARQLKTDQEIAHIEQNMTDTVGAFVLVEEILAESKIVGESIHYQNQILTSELVKQKLAHYFVDHNLITPEGVVVAGGRQGADPHHKGSGSLCPHEPIVVDLFPQSTTNFYWADMTRTYVKGEPSETVQKMYETVAAAQAAAFSALKPGVSYADAYQVSADVILEHGFDVGESGYIHSLGHGLGVGLHEEPHVSPRADGVLRVGEVVTIEPGLYYPNHGGVRLEDTVVIAEEGYQNLTNHPCHFVIS